MKKTISLRIDEDLLNTLEDFKINHHVNISSFIASAIKEKLENKKPLAK